MNRIKELRKSANLTLDKLSSKVKIAHNTLSQYENEKREASYETLHNLATFFGVSIDYLLGYDDKDSQLITINQVKQKFIDSLTPTQRILVTTMLQLNEVQQLQVQSYMQGMLSK